MSFQLLKRTYPISQCERACDGYCYIMDNSTETERVDWGIDDGELQKIITIGEKYIYQVGKENGIFKIMSISFKNYEIIRKKMFKFADD